MDVGVGARAGVAGTVGTAITGAVTGIGTTVAVGVGEGSLLSPPQAAVIATAAAKSTIANSSLPMLPLSVSIIIGPTYDKVQLDKEENRSLSRRYLETYAGFIVTVFLALWFFWNWGDEFITSSGNESDVNLLIWAFINPLFVVVTGLTGCRLWTSR